MAFCAASASLIASTFSCLPVLRMSVASSWNCLMSDDIFMAAWISVVKVITLAFSSLILALSALTLSFLSFSEAVVFSISKSHQALWLDSSICSCLSLKIIFWMVLMISWNCLGTWLSICMASRSRAREWYVFAVDRSSWTARF